jgi:hypothetical protein
LQPSSQFGQGVRPPIAPAQQAADGDAARYILEERYFFGQGGGRGLAGGSCPQRQLCRSIFGAGHLDAQRFRHGTLLARAA